MEYFAEFDGERRRCWAQVQGRRFAFDTLPTSVIIGCAPACGRTGGCALPHGPIPTLRPVCVTDGQGRLTSWRHQTNPWAGPDLHPPLLRASLRPGELVQFSGSWDGRPFSLRMRPLGARTRPPEGTAPLAFSLSLRRALRTVVLALAWKPTASSLRWERMR